MEFADYIEMLKALGENTRFRIFEMLRNGTLCGCKILEQLNITQPTLSHHMKVLCDCGLVKAHIILLIVRNYKICLLFWAILNV